MNDKDFVHYQDLFNNDPAVKRLCEIIFTLEDRWADATEGIDINEYGIVDGDYGRGSIGEYIRHIEYDLRIAEDDIRDYQDKIDTLEDRLKTRTVAQLLLDAAADRDKAKALSDTYFKQTMKLERQVDELTEKLNTWGALSKEY